MALLNRVEDRARASAIETARIVTALTVHQNVPEAHFDAATGGLTPSDEANLDSDVAALVAAGRLVGLEVWRSDGQLLYADNGHDVGEQVLPADERARIEIDKPWVSTRDFERGIATVDVHLPYEAGQQDGTPDGLVEMFFPEASVNSAVATTSRQLYLAATALLLASGLALSTFRRRFARREHDASHDRLTGLMNWGGFRDTVSHTLAVERLHNDRLGAVLLIDLDGFKLVNDTLGHPAGDALLKLVAREIRATVRTQDIVARLGGDEFAVLITGFREAGHATQAASQLRDRLQSTSFEVEGIGLGIEASIGIALIPTHGNDVDTLLRRVDVAMYRAKRTGIGVATYNEADDPNDVGELKMLGELRRGIDNDYQPKAQIAGRHVTGVEALVRWRHPTRGVLAPDLFIPLAESTGLLGPLTHWVLSRAIEDAAHWHRGGLPLSVAVNVSPRSLIEGDLPAAIVCLLAKCGLPSRLLEVEVTETAIMTDPAGSSNVLRQLRAIGIPISIDDFGSGYTSLGYLKTLPIDALKIDRSLISDLTADDKGLAVTQSIIDLGHRLGLTVLAEGVETEETWRLLESLGCDEGQGYLLARPMPAEHIEGWITSHQHSRESWDPTVQPTTL